MGRRLSEMVDTIMLSVNSREQLQHRPDEDEDAFKTEKPPDNGKMFETKYIFMCFNWSQECFVSIWNTIKKEILFRIVWLKLNSRSEWLWKRKYLYMK